MRALPKLVSRSLRTRSRREGASRRHRVCAVASVLAGLAAFTATEKAQASGYLAARYGADHGTPAMANGYAVYFNPAALGGTAAGTELTVDGTLALRFASYTRPASALSPSDPALKNDANYVAANSGKATLTNVLGFPFLSVTSNLGTKNFRFGFAGYVPFGGQASWDKNESLRGNAGAIGGVDGPQRWANIQGRILSIYGSLAASYTFEPIRLSVGANVSAIYNTVDTVRARNTNGSDDTSLNGALIEGRSLLQAHGINVGASIGLYWVPMENRKLRLGLSYTSQPNFGQMRLPGELTNQIGSVKAVSTPTKVDLLQTFPDLVRLGGVYQLTDRVVLRGDVEYVRWSVFKRQCVVTPGAACEVDGNGAETSGAGAIILNLPRNWKDSVGFRIGPGVALTENFEVFGSFGVTTPAAPKTTIDASTIDALRLNGALGARYAITKSIAVAGSYNIIYFLPVDTAGTNQLYNYSQPSKSPSADGTYNATLMFLNANVNVAF